MRALTTNLLGIAMLNKFGNPISFLLSKMADDDTPPGGIIVVVIIIGSLILFLILFHYGFNAY
jgi:hypothetical protein